MTQTRAFETPQMRQPVWRARADGVGHVQPGPFSIRRTSFCGAPPIDARDAWPVTRKCNACGNAVEEGIR
jgi:hypothetical protein